MMTMVVDSNMGLHGRAYKIMMTITMTTFRKLRRKRVHCNNYWASSVGAECGCLSQKLNAIVHGDITIQRYYVLPTLIIVAD